MAYLATNPVNTTDGGTLELDGASSVTSADVGGFTYVFVAGGVDDGISVFRLNANGTLTAIFDVTDAGALELDNARGLSTTTIDGNTYLFAAGFDDNGVSVFRVGTNGSLTAVANVTDDATLKLAGAADTASIRVGTSTYLFVAGQTDDGISSFRVAGDGRLTSIADTADSGTVFLDGVRALSTVTVGGTAYLIAGGSVDNGISVFSVSAGGALTAVTNLADNATLRLAGVSDITTTVIGGTTYVYVAGATDSGVSVFTLSAAGVLTNIDNEVDSASTLIAGANSIAVHNIGATSYLMVGSASENGLSLYRIENGSNNSTAGTLTFVENIADSGSRTLGGAVSVHGATVGGTSYFIGAGQTDDGVSTFGAGTTGQIWYATEGNLADARIGYFNTDGSNPTTVFDNNPSTDLTTGFVESVVVDSAAGIFYALVTGNEGINAKIVMGRIGSATPPTVVFTFDPIYAGSENNLAFNLEIDTITHKLYVGYIEFSPTFDPTTQGIRQFDYNTTSGAVTGGTFFVRESTAVTPPGTAGADGLFASQDFEIDSTRNVVYSQNLALGDSFETNSILRFSLSSPGGAAGVSVINQSQFTLNDPGTGVIATSNGIIADIEIDRDSDRLYFLTRGVRVEEAGTLDSIWVVANASTAVNATPVKLTLVGITLSDFYPEDMTLDEVNNILYIESENSNLVGGGITDNILVFQLDAAGTTGTLINTIPMSFGTTANIEGMHFSHLVTLGALTAAAGTVTEQGSAFDLLTASPAITDFDGDRLSSATVQVTGGGFVSNESSSADDSLGHSAAMTQAGLIAGTNITISWSAATSTLTLTGYDTFANYQAALNNIHFRSFGDNPTNYGLNPSRTITWTISDGLPNIPGGSRNSGTTTVAITAVNDAPVNTVGATLAATEDATVNVTGMSVSDVDANPGITDIVVSFTVTQGTITFLTNVAGGITAGDITGGANGTATVTVTATQNEINATLAATGGLTFTPTANYNGAATLTVVSNDNGATGNDPGLTGTGTTEQDSDIRNITIAAVNDAPVATGSATATAVLEDSIPAGQTVSALFVGNYSDATDQVTGGSSADAFAGVVITSNVASANGAWQYFNGTSFVAITTGVTAATGFAIAAGTLIRFLPALNFNGAAPTLTATLVDASGGALTNGATVNAATTGGTTRFSTASVVLSQSVTSVNDAPTSTGLQGDSVTTTEPAGAASIMSGVNIDSGGNMTFADVDNANFNGGTLRFAITAGKDATQDQLLIDTTGIVTIAAGVVSVSGTAIGTVTGGGSGGSDLVIALNASATPALLQSVARVVFFTSTGGDNPTAGARTITTTLIDGSGTSNGGVDTLSMTSTVTVAATNDVSVAVADPTNPVNENATVAVSVLTNDTDPDTTLAAANITSINGAAATIGNAVTLASGATATINANGTITYNPNGRFNTLIDAATAAATNAVNTSATDSFTYTLVGGSIATVTVQISGVQSSDDQLGGGAGNETITGTPGVDYFNLSQGGNDTATGGASNDAFFFGAAFTALDNVDGGPGTNDQVGLQGNYSGGLTLGAGSLVNIETLAVLPGFSYNITSIDANVAAGRMLSVYGGGLGVGDNFTFNGSAETDGSFAMFGGLGNDTFTGGALDDGFYFGPSKWGAGDTVNGGAGTNDQLALDGSYTISVGSNANVEVLALLPGPGGSPNTFNITLLDAWTAAATTKTVWGAQVTTAMTINGAAETNGNLILFGGAVSDTLTGGTGADTISGGGGGDAMTGGLGADIFRYDNTSDSTGSTNATRDRILDFAAGDKIDLSRIDAITGGGDDAFTFIGTAAFSNTAGQLRYTDLGGGIFNVEGDVNGDNIADFAILVTAGPGYAWTGGDFIP